MKEIRTAEIRTEAPTAEDATSLVLEGMPIIYDTPTIINDPHGAYTEVIQSGALDDCDISDSRLFYAHDYSRIPLARTPKTMTLEVTKEGLKMRAMLPDTEEARSVYTAVKRGDLSGMSFGFKVPEGGDKWDSKTNTRIITRIEKVYEVSVVPFPAYPLASVEARSEQQKLQKREEALKNMKILCNKILMKRSTNK